VLTLLKMGTGGSAMSQSRRRVLMAGSALGLAAAAGLAGCDQTTVVDNATGNATSPAGGAPPTGATGGGTPSASGNTVGATSGGTSAGGGTPPAGPPIRYDVASAQGQAMLAIYARAVGLMMALPATDPRSWTFQWYSHWVKGAQDSSGKTSQLSSIFGAGSSPAKSLAQVMWDGCQAHGDNEDENFFLPWHRLFVMAFENIIRGVTGEPSFTLPYWNYLDAGQRSIPPQFRQASDPVWGPLFNANRNAAVNAGGAIASAADLSPEVLTETTYSSLGADQGFCANLDLGLHGTVHVGVGNSTDGMGLVPWAADDPIFWLHHCNIDRIWASWNALGNANPSDAEFTSKPFPFADPNGSQVVFTAGQVLSLQQAGYGYDALVGENGQAVAQTARLETRRPLPFQLPQFDVANAATTEPRLGAPLEAPRRPVPVLRTLPSITHVSEGVRLGGSALRIRLISTQGSPEVAARTLAPLIAPAIRMQRRPAPPPTATSRLLGLLNLKAARGPTPVASAPPPAPAAPPPLTPAPKPGQKVFLVLNNLSTDIQPGVIYEVYLEAPAKNGGTQAYPIGALSFFSAMRAMSGMTMASRARSFDITALATTLATQGRLETSPAITFVPVGKPATQAQPLIGSVSLAIQ